MDLELDQQPSTWMRPDELCFGVAAALFEITKSQVLNVTISC